MKWLGLLLVLALVGGSWFTFSKAGGKLEALEARIESLMETGDPDAEVPGLQNEIQSVESSRTFNGILLAFATAILLGVLFVTFVLPGWASRVSQSVYGSNAEMDEPTTVFREARSLLARGDHEGAIDEFRKATAEDPANRVPWAEISRIQIRYLEQPREAIATLNEALAARDWPEEDLAFFLFRLAELHHEEPQGKAEAASALQRIIREFPDSRHAMNARHRVKEWGLG